MRRRNFHTWLMQQVERDDDVGHLAERVRRFTQAYPRHERSIEGIRASGAAPELVLNEALDEWRAEVGAKR